MQDWEGQLVSPSYIRCLKVGLGIAGGFSKHTAGADETLVLSVCCSMTVIIVLIFSCFLVIIVLHFSRFLVMFVLHFSCDFCFSLRLSREEPVQVDWQCYGFHPGG